MTLQLLSLPQPSITNDPLRNKTVIQSIIIAKVYTFLQSNLYSHIQKQCYITQTWNLSSSLDGSQAYV